MIIDNGTKKRGVWLTGFFAFGMGRRLGGGVGLASWDNEQHVT